MIDEAINETGNRLVSARVSDELYKLAKEHKISITNALRVGLSVLLADEYVIPYDNKLNLYRKMRAYQFKTEQLFAEMQKLAQEYEDKPE